MKFAFAGGTISGIVEFADASLFDVFGLPSELEQPGPAAGGS
jgi:hypothetical protein